MGEVAFSGNNVATVTDARDLRETCDLWITDPPYADAVNYHELGDFFLAWYGNQLAKAFPETAPESGGECRHVLAEMSAASFVVAAGIR